MGAHTPGPWELGPQIIACVEGIETAFVSVEQPGFVAGGGLALVHIKHSESNARLIASAPDLLAALEALLPYVEHSDSCGDRDAYNNADVETCGCGLDSAVDVARAAIALATGGHR